MVESAFARLAPTVVEDLPKLDLVGPTVDDDIRRAISRYGADAVKGAVKRLTKRKLGRKAEKDWPQLRSTLEEDARRWLDGGDPFTERSNYSIAQAYADAHSGHSHAATQRRIMKKLSEKRVYFTLITALRISEPEYPHGYYFKTLAALIELEPSDAIWSNMLDTALRSTFDYISKFGQPPETITIRDLEAQARDAVVIPETKPPLRRRGLFGSLR